MTILDGKQNLKAFTIIELIALIVVIALFWFGLKLGVRLTVELFPDYKNESWFAIVGLIGAFIGGVIPVAIFVGTCYCIGMFLNKKKKGKRK